MNRALHLFTVSLSLLLPAFAANAQQPLDSLQLPPLFPGLVIPIPQQPFANPPKFIGSPAIANPFPGEPVPQSPFMAPNGLSSVHLNAYQTDTYATPGPLGHNPEVNSTFLAALCGTVTFDAKGRILVVCVGFRPTLYLLDPVTLERLAVLQLPQGSSNGTFGAGGYFYTDQLNRAIIPTQTDDIFRIKVVDKKHGPTLVLDHTCSSSLPQLVPSSESILSVFPDSSGLLWFTLSGDSSDPTNKPGQVGTLQPDPSDSNKCAIQLFKLPAGELIQKSFAVDPDPSRGGVFIVSDHQLYRFDPSPSGLPTVTWHEPYERGSGIKLGQLVDGSGTTPTLMSTDLVTIDDNAPSQINVLVFQRTANPVSQRQICKVPVFQPGASASFNSLIATDKSITIENNFGYDVQNTLFGRTTSPGITRIDVDDDRQGCHVVWTNNQLSVPNVVSQASLATGLEYTYIKEPSSSLVDAWYFAAVDMHTGATVYKVLAGTGVLYDSHYSSVYVGPDGKTAYVGVLGGLVRIHDTY